MTPREKWIEEWLDEVFGMASRIERFDDDKQWSCFVRARMAKVKGLLGRMYDSFNPTPANNGQTAKVEKKP